MERYAIISKNPVKAVQQHADSRERAERGHVEIHTPPPVASVGRTRARDISPPPSASTSSMRSDDGQNMVMELRSQTRAAQPSLGVVRQKPSTGKKGEVFIFFYFYFYYLQTGLRVFAVFSVTV